MSIQLQDRTLKALSLLLSYPTVELQQAMPEIGAVLASETRLTAATRRDMRPLVEALTSEEEAAVIVDNTKALIERAREAHLLTQTPER